MKNIGTLICRVQNNIYQSDGFLSMFITIITTYDIPAKIKTIPPTISRFHEIATTAARIRAGILCINNPTAISQALNPGSKTSNENNIRKRTSTIDRILGVQ